MFTRLSAVLALACGVAAMGWLRPFLTCSLDDAGFLAFYVSFVAALALGFVATGRLRAFQAQGPNRSAARKVSRVIVGVAVGLICGIAAVQAMNYWFGRFGAYAIPRADVLGLALALAAMALGAVSIRQRGRIQVIAVVAILLGAFVLVTGYLLDRFARCPYFTVRQFAAVADRADQNAMKRFFSRRSLQHFDQLPRTAYGVGGEYRPPLVTVDLMLPGWARGALLWSVDEEGVTAEVRCLVPYYWNVMGFGGHGGTIPLVKEDGLWKIDAYKYFELRRARLEMLDRGDPLQ